MMDLKNKMETNKELGDVNPVFMTQNISKIMDRIRKGGPNSDKELKNLKDLCLSSQNVTIAATASQGIIYLVEHEVLSLSATFSEFIPSILFAKTPIAVTNVICGLLRLDLTSRLSRNKKYKCQFNLCSPQHPLISLLHLRGDIWNAVLCKITDFYKNGSNPEAALYANELLYPFYMYVFFDPVLEIPELLQHKLWKFVININMKQSLDIVLYTILWLQISTKKHIMKTTHFLTELLNFPTTESMNEVIILWLTSCIYELIKQDHDPSNVIACLDTTLNANRHLLDSTSSYLLFMLAESIIICPSFYLHDLLMLCKTIVLSNSSDNLALRAIYSVLLQWLPHECTLMLNSLPIINKIISHIENSETNPSVKSQKLLHNKPFNFLKSSNKHIHLASELVILSQNFASDKNTLSFLKRMITLSSYNLKRLFNYFAALFLCKFESNVILDIMSILIKITDTFKEKTTHLMTLILYKLSNTTEPRLHLALLKSLPKMGVIKENLPLIINTLQLTKQGTFRLKSFAMTLFYDLWNVDSNCFHYLHDMLNMPFETENPTQMWEFQIIKAHIFREICIRRPEVHGHELVGNLSVILNQSHGEIGTVPSALALEAIQALCQAGIIDIKSTWNELSTKFDSETRVLVIESLFKLMTEISCLETTTDSDKLLENILSKLWKYATTHDNIYINRSAYTALESFNLEQISSCIPDMIKNPDIVNNSSNLVHGSCWIKLLLTSKISILDAVGDFLIKRMKVEISDYGRGIYKVDDHREPQNFDYLPTHSIVRALTNYIRKIQNIEENRAVYLQILRVLSQEYSRPLPPTNWCFLQELIHVSEARIFCITLASHQVQLSGSARRLVENYIVAITNSNNNDEAIETIYKNLKYMCNSIQPIILRPFVEGSLINIMKKCQDSDDIKNFNMLNTMIKNLSIVLSDNELHNSNKSVLSDIIAKFAREADPDNLIFTKLLESIVVLPGRYIDELSSSRFWKEETLRQTKLSVKIRCAVALHDKLAPLKWLNDLIDVGSTMPLEHDYILLNIANVVESYRESELAVSWIVELLGRIQATIANESTSNYQLEFFCDVFIISMIVLSDQNIFVMSPNDLVTILEYRLRLFPQSIADLIENRSWHPHITQLLEWLFHMTNYPSTPQIYKRTFYQTLAALRHANEFEKQSEWMKYIGSFVPVDS